MEILDTFNLVQHIHEPTHTAGNTLDLVITRKDSKAHGFIVSSQLSDHSNIIFSLNLSKPTPLTKTVTNRRLKNVDTLSF